MPPVIVIRCRVVCHNAVFISGSALGLLLVFRTNTAYNRFWEGRRIWEKILNSLRDLGRMTVLYGDVIQPARVERILHLLCAFPLGDFNWFTWPVSLCNIMVYGVWCIGSACAVDIVIEGSVIRIRTREEVFINNSYFTQGTYSLSVLRGKTLTITIYIHLPHMKRTAVLQEHVQGFRQPTELSSLLTYGEIIELDRVTNRYIYFYFYSWNSIIITAAILTICYITLALAHVNYLVILFFQYPNHTTHLTHYSSSYESKNKTGLISLLVRYRKRSDLSKNVPHLLQGKDKLCRNT